MKPIKINITTPNNYPNKRFRMSVGSGGGKIVKPSSFAYWLDKYINKATETANLASAGNKKPVKVAIVVKYSQGVENESLDSLDQGYLLHTGLSFVEDYISDNIFNKTLLIN